MLSGQDIIDDMEVQKGEHSNARLLEGKVGYLLCFAVCNCLVWAGSMIQSCMSSVRKNTYKNEKNLGKQELERK